MTKNHFDKESSENKELNDKISKIILSYGNEYSYDNSYSEQLDIANKLFDLLRDKPNHVWRSTYPNPASKDCIFAYCSPLSIKKQIILFKNGMNPALQDLKLPYGVDRWLWLIGNAQYECFRGHLDIIQSLKNENPSYDCSWLATTDLMYSPHDRPPATKSKRGLSNLLLCGLFNRPPKKIMKIHNNALTLLAAKGYTDKCGSGHKLTVSSCDLIKKLLHFPEMKAEINYQEQGLGHTALHMACIRRDLAMIVLLLDRGADAAIKNHNGQTPKDLLDDLHYKDARNVLAFHTSPEGHPNTFKLDKESFNNIENLNDCHRCIDTSYEVAISPRI